MIKKPDFYYKQAHLEGYRTRAAYKLIELDNKLSFLASSHCIIELGAAPGGWTQVIRKHAPQAQITVCDIQPMKPIEGVTFIQGDFRLPTIQQQILSLVKKTDLVLSDMSPNISGQKSRDQAAMAELCLTALQFAHKVINKGTFVVKMFQGEEGNNIIAKTNEFFNKVRIIKPSSSRKNSNEVYLYMKR